MIAFVRFFLTIYLADGCLSFIDDAISLFSGASPLSGVRSILANAVILLALALYVCLGVDRRLPKRLLLPQTVYIMLCPLIPLFLPALSGGNALRLALPAGQVALGLLPLIIFRKDGVRGPSIPSSLFTGTFFSLRNTLAFGAINLLVVPPVLAMAVFQVAGARLSAQTSGFMSLTPAGIYMSERVYKRDNRTIRLAAMIHIGEREYYDDVTASVPTGRTIVLAEGVTDRGNRLGNKFDYRQMAGFLGLTSQEKMRYRGNVIEAGELDKAGGEQPAGDKKARKEPVDILRADVDTASFRPPTIVVLDAIGRQLRRSPSPVKAFLALNTWAEKNVTPEMYGIVMEDILQRRNRVVLGHLWKALASYDTVVIPWGALHMREIEAEVLKRGFVFQEERKRLGVSFRRVLSAGS